MPPGTCRDVEARGQTMAVFNVEETIYDIGGEFTHRGGLLGEGELDGTVVTCPLHGAQFDVTTGQAVARQPGRACLRTRSLPTATTSRLTSQRELPSANPPDRIGSGLGWRHGVIMTYIITEACIGVKDRACVDVCPVDCIYEGPDQLYIHPDECIDCGACEPECPVTAIFPEEAVPADQKRFIALNKEIFEGPIPPGRPSRQV